MMRRIIALQTAWPQAKTGAKRKTCRSRRANHRRRRDEVSSPPARPGDSRPPTRRKVRLARSRKQRADLETLRSVMADFDGCALKRTATQLVFADGVPGSRVMFVGEAPGGDEDRIGRPFVGRAGQLLDRMLNSIGLDRQTVYIANVVPWRPPGNRTPTPQETQICLPFIERQIELANPEFLVCLGASAARTLLGVEGGIMRARGSWFAYPRQVGREIRALAMLHPAFLLRQPAHKRFAWADMRALAQRSQTARLNATRRGNRNRLVELSRRNGGCSQTSEVSRAGRRSGLGGEAIPRVCVRAAAR